MCCFCPRTTRGRIVGQSRLDVVGNKADVLSAQRSGVAILDGIRAIFGKLSTSNDPKQQEDIARATKLLQHGRAVEITRQSFRRAFRQDSSLPAWACNRTRVALSN